ncbi:hypothetical protein GCM10017782_00020 [Deinococcus ficus]|nr:hypothetical protein GCM10017782_00020 [Deinococcus ficus]
MMPPPQPLLGERFPGSLHGVQGHVHHTVHVLGAGRHAALVQAQPPRDAGVHLRAGEPLALNATAAHHVTGYGLCELQGAAPSVEGAYRLEHPTALFLHTGKKRHQGFGFAM